MFVKMYFMKFLKIHTDISVSSNAYDVDVLIQIAGRILDKTSLG